MFGVKLSGVLLVLASASIGHAQTNGPDSTPFGLGSANGVSSHWFDGADVLLTSERAGIVVRHRDGTRTRVPGIGSAVHGIGQGRHFEAIAVRNHHITRLREGRWEDSRVSTNGTPTGVVLAPTGQAMAWNSLSQLLFHISADNVVTPVSLGGLRPESVLWMNGEFVVVVRARHGVPEHPVMRYSDGQLLPHAFDEAVNMEARCRDPRGALLLEGGTLVLQQRRYLCFVDASGVVSVLDEEDLFGDDFGDGVDGILQIAASGEDLLLLDSSGGVHRVSHGASEPMVELPLRNARGMFVDPRSGTVAVFQASATAISSTPGERVEVAQSESGWVSEIELGSAGSPPVEGGIQHVLPTGRLGFGGVATLSPDGPGSFAFDVVGGVRLLFRSGGRHPVLGAEFGYSRRGGELETHDLLLGLTAGYTSLPFGVQIAESLVIPVGEGRSGLGLRSALRVTTLFDIVGLEVAHGLNFATDRHELRILLNLELAQLIVLGTLLGKISQHTH